MSFNGRIVGGGAYGAFFGVSIGTTQTTLASTTPVYTCQAQITTDAALDDSGIPTFTLEQFQADSAFFNFVKNYRGSVQATPPEDLTKENGSRLLGTATGTVLAYLIKGGTVIDGTDNGKNLILGGLARLVKSSGSVNFAAGAYNRPSLSFVAEEMTQPLTFSTAVVGLVASTTGTAWTLSTTQEAYGAVTHQ